MFAFGKKFRNELLPVKHEQDDQSASKENKGEWTDSIIKEKFTDHPSRVGENPGNHCQVVHQFRIGFSHFPGQP